RLVVVADRTELVAVAEPPIEQRLLQEVHVLVLVDGERAEVAANLGQGAGILVEETDRRFEEVLEVDEPSLFLLDLVAAEDAEHQIRRDRRLVLAQAPPGRPRRQAEVLCPPALPPP